MLVIDILNGLQYAGADFSFALAAARQRTRFVNPILRRIVAYASREPQAYQCRFSPSLLASAVYLLCEAKDPDLVQLAMPLICTEAQPNLFDCDPDDYARLLAAGVGNEVERLAAAVTDERASDEFRTTVFDALVLAVVWSPELRNKVTSVLRSFLGHETLNTFTPDIREAIVECCCRLDPVDFLLDIQFAIGRGDLDESSTTDMMIAASKRSPGSIDLSDWMETAAISPADTFLRQYSTVFTADELRNRADAAAPHPDALELFNSVTAPTRDYLERFARLHLGWPETLDVATRVVQFAATTPDQYLNRHSPIALSAAICFASPFGDEVFTQSLASLMRISEAYLDRLLGDDLTEMCEAALALSSRSNPALVQQIVEDCTACGTSRCVALGALMQQVRLGYLEEASMVKYCAGLIAHRKHVLGTGWLWSDIAAVGAELGAAEMLPALKIMVEEGLFEDGHGNALLDADELESQFAIAPRPKASPLPVNAMDLIRLCSGYESMIVADLLGRLEPPRYETVMNEQ